MSPSLHQDGVQITILYGSIAVHTEVVNGSQGCRIFSGLNISLDKLLHPEAEKMFGPPEAHQIPLPSNHPDSRAANMLNAMKRGLILNVNNNDIYATALCRATVHHGSSPREASFPLNKEETCKVFDYNNDFLPLESWKTLSHPIHHLQSWPGMGQRAPCCSESDQHNSHFTASTA